MLNKWRGLSLGEKTEKRLEAYVDDEAKIGDKVSIGRFAEILSGSVIGDNCVIGSRCIIGHASKLELQEADFSAASPKVSDLRVRKPVTKIGEGAIVRSGSTIYRHVVVGRNLRTGHGVVIREHVTIGDNCIVGTQAVLDGYIRIGSGSMIQSHCYVSQSVRIGNAVFIAPGCVFTDNRKIVLGEGLNGATVGDYARIGAGTKILPGVTIGRYALVGAGSVVSKDIPDKALAYGIPARTKGYQEDGEIQKYVKSVANWK